MTFVVLFLLVPDLRGLTFCRPICLAARLTVYVGHITRRKKANAGALHRLRAMCCVRPCGRPGGAEPAKLKLPLDAHASARTLLSPLSIVTDCIFKLVRRLRRVPLEPEEKKMATTIYCSCQNSSYAPRQTKSSHRTMEKRQLATIGLRP